MRMLRARKARSAIWTAAAMPGHTNQEAPFRIVSSHWGCICNLLNTKNAHDVETAVSGIRAVAAILGYTEQKAPHFHCGAAAASCTHAFHPRERL